MRPEGPARFNSLDNRDLAVSLMRSCQSGERQDLEEAISLHRDALELMPVKSIQLPQQPRRLANNRDSSSQVNGGDLDEAILLHRGALKLRPGGHPS
jgi:hypothetical protein